MTLLFVFGVMNLVWVAALALFVMVEKLLPVGPRFTTGVGIAAAIMGLGMIIGVRLPGAP
jgi:predicted metal-binding membrane protein